jgi:hypothetical protein
LDQLDQRDSIDLIEAGFDPVKVNKLFNKINKIILVWDKSELTCWFMNLLDKSITRALSWVKTQTSFDNYVYELFLRHDNFVLELAMRNQSI